MSLAYALDNFGRYQVAYEAMDKVSIFKFGYTWIWWCPCCNSGTYCAGFSSAIHIADKHLTKNHPNED